jgi:pimeloyl-ACP methyl ester carboxylesterase
VSESHYEELHRDCYFSLHGYSSPGTDASGFVAIDYTNQLIVVAFRGTASLLGWIIDLSLNRVPTTICNGCGAHQGFWASWLSVRDAIFNTVRDAVAANPGFSVVCTGHSLGGAIASLAAADLRNTGYNATLVLLQSRTVGRFGCGFNYPNKGSSTLSGPPVSPTSR